MMQWLRKNHTMRTSHWQPCYMCQATFTYSNVWIFATLRQACRALCQVSSDFDIGYLQYGELDGHNTSGEAEDEFLQPD